MKKIILILDTAQREKTIVSLRIDRESYDEVIDSSRQKSQVVLSLIDRLLQRKQLSLSEITEIRINSGPGSFTGLRVGVAIANTLGWYLGIPVNGKKGQIVEPLYE